jgi:hypothetical protein
MNNILIPPIIMYYLPNYLLLPTSISPNICNNLIELNNMYRIVHLLHTMVLVAGAGVELTCEEEEIANIYVL